MVCIQTDNTVYVSELFATWEGDEAGAVIIELQG